MQTNQAEKSKETMEFLKRRKDFFDKCGREKRITRELAKEFQALRKMFNDILRQG